jgi:hypothetical protein
LDALLTPRRRQIPDGEVYPNTKDHHRHFKEGQYSSNIPPHHYNCRPRKSRGHYNSRRNVEWRLAGRIKSIMAPDPMPTQTILGNITNTLTPQYQPSHFSVSLDKQLGSWYLVARNTWYQCYKSRCNLYLRQIEGTTITELLLSKTKG